MQHRSDRLQCQALGEFLEYNCPDVQVKYVIKDASEWNEFCDSVCRSYGFDRMSCPLVYTLEGTPIGDGRNFIDHVKERFSISLSIPIEN